MDARVYGNWMSDDLKDMLNKEFIVGDKVAKAATSGRAVNLSIGVVTRIENGKLYLDNSKVAINYPGRLLIVTKLFEDEQIGQPPTENM